MTTAFMVFLPFFSRIQGRSMPVHLLYLKALNLLATSEVKSQKKADCMVGVAICF